MEYIYEKDGMGGEKKRKAVRRNCENCGKSFLVAIRFIIKGKGNYCCKDCANEAQREKISNRVTLICSNCGVHFDRVKSKLYNSKSGLYFCSRQCKDIGQRIDSGLYDVHPSHYGNGERNYRKIAFRVYKKICACCGYKEDVRILEVHHIDGNRKNNDICNLIIMCPNCHRKVTLGYYKLLVEGYGIERSSELVCN